MSIFCHRYISRTHDRICNWPWGWFSSSHESEVCIQLVIAWSLAFATFRRGKTSLNCIIHQLILPYRYSKFYGNSDAPNFTSSAILTHFLCNRAQFVQDAAIQPLCSDEFTCLHNIHAYETLVLAVCSIFLFHWNFLCGFYTTRTSPTQKLCWNMILTFSVQFTFTSFHKLSTAPNEQKLEGLLSWKTQIFRVWIFYTCYGPELLYWRHAFHIWSSILLFMWWHVISQIYFE